MRRAGRARGAPTLHSTHSTLVCTFGVSNVWVLVWPCAPSRWCRYCSLSRRVARMGRSAIWLLPGMPFGRFRGTIRLSTRQCFGVTKFLPRGVHDLYGRRDLRTKSRGFGESTFLACAAHVRPKPSGREVWPQAYMLGPPAGTQSLLCRMRRRNFIDRSSDSYFLTAGTAGPIPGGVADRCPQRALCPPA